jgi:hypothetical protein
MASRAWPASDDHLPGGSAANTIDTLSQDQSEDIRERDVQGGHKHNDLNVASSTANDEGKHCVGIESTPNTDFGELTLAWDFAGTSKRIRHFGSSHARADETEFPGDVVLLSGKRLQGLAYGAFIRLSGYEALPVLNGYTAQVLWKVPEFTGALSRTLTRTGLIVGSRPVGSSLIAQFRQVDASHGSFGDTLNRFADSAPISVADTVTLTAGSDYSKFNTGLSVTFDVGDELVVKWTSIGSTTPAADVTIIAQFE